MLFFVRRAGLGLACLLFLAIPARAELVLSLENDEGDAVFSMPVKEGTLFGIRYIHSVAQTPVTDYFKIKDASIWLDRTVYSDFGAGLPHNPEDGQVFSHHNGQLVLSGFNRKLGSFQLRVGRVAEHMLLVLPGRGTKKGPREIPLARLAEPGSTLTFAVRQSKGK